MRQDLLIIGIDGGATKVSAWTVDQQEDGTFELGNQNVQKQYSEYKYYDPNFKPVDLNIQLKEMETGIHLTPAENRQGLAYMYAAADVIIELAKTNPGKDVLIGIGMPGLKTKDKRGISVLANGPRLPEYASIIENRIMLHDVELASPIHHIGSDADYCGIGEEYSSQGSFRGVENSYYLGGGTGVADALKLRGKLVPFDAIKLWMAKTWEMKVKNGKSLERYCSASGIQDIYSEYSGISIPDLNTLKIYAPQIMEKALQGEEAAIKTMKDVSFYLAELLFERISTLYAGYQGKFDFVNPERAPLIPHHPYQGTLLDRLVIGQRLGDYLEESRGKNQMWEPMLQHLSELVSENEMMAKEFKSYYLKEDTFNDKRIVLSKLREAPAMGAAVDAWLCWKGEN
ncbi:MAG: hypothetical protein PHE86_00500 [Candidatus Marinimicrobia bacterium]|nr:hypothetical protein [Candidatus Neomarinimicrobiota bacterium]MDD5582049.1 hypothetical protein [Candidatus Neomarinimicrobiota bacterium]